MYSDQLKPLSVPIDSVHLDPNNPRFWTQQAGRISDRRTPEAAVQAAASQTLLDHHRVVDLRNSILRNGFLPLDRIVVRPLKGLRGQYVVIEGNRRLAAIRLLRKQIKEGTVAAQDVTDAAVKKIHRQTNTLHVLVYKGSEQAEDISWILQGIRHIGGIRNWEPAQRAKLVVDQIEQSDPPRSYRDVGHTFGLTSHAVGRLYRAYKALRQMQNDDEFSDDAKNEYFTLFEEAWRNKTVKDWLEWKDDGPQSGFQNLKNCKMFYSWIIPDPDDEPDNRRRLHDPRHVKLLGILLAGGHTKLLDRVNDHEVSIQAAAQIADNVDTTRTWREKLEAALEQVRSLPLHALEQDPSGMSKMLSEMLEIIEKYKHWADSLDADANDTT